MMGAGRTVDPNGGTHSATAIRPIERIACADAGCAGCNAVHRRYSGQAQFYVDGRPATEYSFRLVRGAYG